MFDLKHGLTDLGGAPRIDGDPIDIDRASARVRRRRIARSAGITAGSAAAVAGIAAVAWAVGPWSTPHPPADPSPTVEPPPTTPEPTTPEPTGEPTTTDEPSPEATGEPTEAPDEELPPIVGLTEAGAMVLVDPDTGAVIDVVTATGLPAEQHEDKEMSVDWNNRTVYLSRESDDWPNDLVRISLDDGTAEIVGEGYRPAVSPDGSTLAYLAWRPGPEPDSDWIKGPRLIDVASGHEIAFIWSATCGSCGFVLMQATWSPDGSRLVVPAGYSDGGPQSLVLSVLDTTNPPETLAGNEWIGPPSTDDDSVASGYEVAQFRADGSLAVIGYEQTAGSDGMWTSFDYYLAILVDGQIRERVDLPEPTGSTGSSFTLGAAGTDVVINARTSPDGRTVEATTWLWEPGEPLTELQLETPLVSVTW